MWIFEEDDIRPYRAARFDVLVGRESWRVSNRVLDEDLGRDEEEEHREPQGRRRSGARRRPCGRRWAQGLDRLALAPIGHNISDVMSVRLHRRTRVMANVGSPERA